MIYILLFFFLSITFLFSTLNHRIKKTLFIICICVLWFFSAFRFNVGLDEESYRSIYDNINSDFSSAEFSIANYLQEPLFILINVFLIPFNSSQSLFFLFATLNILLIYKSYTKLTYFSILPLLVYYSHRYLHNDLNQIRQGLVSLIFLSSLLFVHKKKYFAFNIAGAFIQVSGLIFFLFYPLRKYFSKPSNIWYWLPGSFLMSLIVTDENILRVIPESFKFVFYLKDARFNYVRNLFIDLSFYKAILILFLMNFNFRKLNLESGYFEILYSAFGFGIFMLISLHNLALVSGRISSLFFTVEPILLYYVVKSYSKYISIYASYLFVVLFCVLTLYFNLNSENSPVTTYKTIFVK